MTITQSDLDDMRRRAERGKIQGICLGVDVLALLDHIAQLTAERDEALARAGKSEADKPPQSMFIDGWFTQEHERQARIAELEAQPSAQFVAGKLEATEEIAWLIESARQTYWDGRKVGREAFFTSNVTDAIRFSRFEDAEIIRCWLLEASNESAKLRSTQHMFINNAILAEAALKGGGK